jgi:hypothetical protein
LNAARALTTALLALVLAIAAGPPAVRADDAEPGPDLKQLLEHLPAERRAEVEAAIEKLSPGQRERILERFEELSPDQRAFIERAVAGQPAIDPVEAMANRRLQNEKRWAEMSELEREAMRSVLRNFQALPERDQANLVDTAFARRTPDKRREVLNRLRDVPHLR